MSKKTINKNVLNSLKEMFPDNKQIDSIILQFKEHLGNKYKKSNSSL